MKKEKGSLEKLGFTNLLAEMIIKMKEEVKYFIENVIIQKMLIVN